VSADWRRWLDAGAAVLAFSVFLVGLVYNTRVAAGADAYGYVSQADLWLRGDLHVDQSFGADVPWPLARWTFVPLGYRPEPDGYRIVPQYPAGLPLLMAAAKLAAGQCAMFWVVPLCGGALVLATYAIGLRIDRPVAGLVAAWIVATSPTLLFMVIAPMSDVPAAAAWAIAIACALGEGAIGAACGGAAAAAAILIRPNLAPIAGVVVAWLWVVRDRRAAVTFAAVASAGAIAVAVVNARLYGSPLASGYDLTDGFAVRYVGPNLRRYVGWLASAESPLALLGLIVLAIPGAAIWRTSAALRARWLLASCAAFVWAFYLVYVPWDAWWYLRFLLPTWPLTAIASAVLLERIAQAEQVGTARGWLAWRRAAVVIAIVALGGRGVVEAARRDTFNAARGEAKYVEVARVVEALTDPGAVIVSAQHSGSVRYYAGRLTLRWDTGDPAWLDRTIAWLAARGHHPYFVLEPQEIEELRVRSGSGNASARLDWTPMVVFANGGVRMFDAVRRERTGTPALQPTKGAVRDCPVQKPWPRL
jgi:hypothetical protein